MNARAHGVNPWLVLVLVCLAQFMVVLDATIVNVALPSIQADLGMSESSLQWIVNAYALLFGGFLLLGGRAGDLIGRKRVFLGGLVLFTVASLLCALATGETTLIVARGLQGLGAALVSPAALSIVTTTFAEGAERTKALGVWAAIAVGGGAVGLVLGGLLVDVLSWPWIFFVNVPVGIAAFLVSLRYVPESKDEHMHKSFDLAGAASVTAGLVALVYGIVRSSALGWGSTEVLGFLALSAVLLVGFVFIERRSAEPLVRLSIFSVRTVRGANAAMFVVAAGLFSMFFFNTLYVQRVLGFSPLEAGFAFVPFTAGVIIGAGLSQRLVPALGAREVPLIGAALGAVGLLLFLRLTPDSSYLTDLLPGIMLASIGMGLLFVPITLIATSGIPNDDAGLASGLFNTSQQIGGALGLALLSTLATNRTEDELASAGAQPTADATADALVSGFHVAWLSSAILLAAGGLLLLGLLRRRDVAAVSEGEVAPVAA
ncbi:MAG TPA: MFS transporter [Gaiella sp.]|uniref:MFS transporter n=1 Tax=Gaiella sp. TaxID=2663207 RepID=UPI002D7FAFBD|nr:MFS transporter [Gaiella sp.]HET9286368.1 MFS transporter [Gaiella sp.]